MYFCIILVRKRVKKMMLYEIKKVFSRTSGRIALLLLLAVLGITCFVAVDVPYVNERGEHETGPAAIAKLKAAQKEWAGELDEETIRQVIRKNRQIRESPEAKADNLQLNEIAYSRGQGIREIRSLLNCSYGEGFQEYDYYRADSLTEENAGSFYANRTALLADWLDTDAKDQFSGAEKEFLLAQYEGLKTPFSYDYMKGWTQLFQSVPTVIMVTMLVLGYLVGRIFSNEFLWRSDAIFFSTLQGRSKAATAKIRAGFCIVTVIYWAAVLLYTGVLLFYLGADGWACPVQADWGSWKCFYHISILEKYLLIISGGYIGCLFISFLSMLVSAKTKSTVTAVTVPFVVIFIPSFLSNIHSPAVSRILGLLPDQLLQTGTALNVFSLYSLGGKITGAVPVILVLYALLTAVLLPVIYREYTGKEVG